MRDRLGLETRDPNNSEMPVAAERCRQPELRDRLELETLVAAAGAQFPQRKKTKRRIEHAFMQVIQEAERANMQESARATKSIYEEVTAHGRAAEPLALAGADAADIEEPRPGDVPLHAQVREENARLREEQEKERPIIGFGRLPQPASPVEVPATRLAATP